MIRSPPNKASQPITDVNSQLADLTISQPDGDSGKKNGHANGTPNGSPYIGIQRHKPRPSMAAIAGANGLERPLKVIEKLIGKLQNSCDSLTVGTDSFKEIDISRYELKFNRFKEIRTLEKEYDEELKNLQESNEKATIMNEEATKRYENTEKILTRRLDMAERRKSLTDAARSLSEELGIKITPIENEINGNCSKEDDEDELEKSVYSPHEERPQRSLLKGSYEIILWNIHPKKPDREYKFDITVNSDSVKSKSNL